MLSQPNSAAKPARRSKGSTQRKSETSSKGQHSHEEEALSSAAISDAVRHSEQPPVSTPSKAGSNPSKRVTRRQREQTRQGHATTSDNEYTNVQHILQQDPADHSTSIMQAQDNPEQASPAPNRRHRRGKSHNPLAVATSTAQQAVRGSDRDESAASPSSPSLLSRSAPTTSFLTSSRPEQNMRHGKYSGFDSADDWDMPTVAKGNDALTWQQQSLGRKPSGSREQNKRANKSTKAPPVPAPSGISALAAAAANNDDREASPSAASSALTWQQELFRGNGASSSPSVNLFEALEEGHSGASPARDRSARSSPVKQSRKLPQSQQQAATVHRVEFPTQVSDKEDGNSIDKLFASLVMKGDKPKRSTSEKQQQPQQTPPPSASKPVPVPAPSASGKNSSRQRQATHPAHASARSGSDTGSPVHSDTEQPLRDDKLPARSTNSTPIAASVPASTLYAGPKFHNSPSAGQLPTPKFFLRSRGTTSPGIEISA